MDTLKKHTNLLYLIVVRCCSLFAKCPIKKIHTNVFKSQLLLDLQFVLIEDTPCECGSINCETTIGMYDAANNKFIIHNEPGSAIIDSCKICVCEQKWLIANKLHNDNGPASIRKILNEGCGCEGSITCELKWYCEGKLHNDDGPAYIEGYIINNGIVPGVPTWCKKHYYAEEWYKDGKLYRDDDEPSRAADWNDGNEIEKSWFIDDKLSRANDKPSVIISNNNTRVVEQWWYQNGVIHRDDYHVVNDEIIGGPAVIITHFERGVTRHEWYSNGKLHRDFSIGNVRPAVYTFYHNNKKHEYYDEEYWIDGKKVNAFGGTFEGRTQLPL